MSGEGETGLELAPSGTRFVRADVEASYGEWRRESSGSMHRVAALVAAAAWILSVPGILVAWPVGAGPWIGAILGVHVPACLGVLRVLRWTPVPRWAPGLLMVPVFTSGILTATLINFHAGLLSEAVAGLCVSIYFCFGIARVPPLHTALAILPSLVLEEIVLVDAYRSGTAQASILYVDTLLLLLAYVTGLVTNVMIDVIARRSFRQERIIEAQKTAIALERARSEGLLKRELGHQVAARSRDLGRLLSQVDGPLLATVAARPKVGERFGARYHVERELGAGAMGAVYEVERLTDCQRLALKVVTGAVSVARATRFAREAEIGARIRHENLLSIVDVGVTEGGVPFLAMELAPRGSLEDRRERFGDVAWARPILAAVARGVAALHEAGVVHRDLKPANVLLVGEDEDTLEAKISDFGISRFGALDGVDVDAAAATLDVGAGRSQDLTATGMILGTPSYMAPEAVRSAKVEAPADVFAFGVLACEMLTGRAPFGVPAIVSALAGQRLPEPTGLGDPRIDARLRETLRACLEEDPARRPTIQAASGALGTARSDAVTLGPLLPTSGH